MLDVFDFFKKLLWESFPVFYHVFSQIWRNWRSSSSAFLQVGLEVLGKNTACHGPEMKNHYLFRDGPFCF